MAGAQLRRGALLGASQVFPVTRPFCCGHWSQSSQVRPDSRFKRVKDEPHLLMGQWHMHAGGKERMTAVVEISPPSHCNYFPHFTDGAIQAKRETRPISQNHQQGAEVGLQTPVSLTPEHSVLHEPPCSPFSVARQSHGESPGFSSWHCFRFAV